MKIQCPHCQGITEVNDTDVKRYVSRLNGKISSEAKADAARANARKPRPGAQGKPKPRKPKK